MSLIHRLRSKPEHIKNRIMIIGSIISTLLIVIVWLVIRVVMTDTNTHKPDTTALRNFINELTGLIMVVKQSDMPELPKPVEQTESVEQAVPTETIIDTGLNPV